MSRLNTPSRYFITLHRTSLALELQPDGFTVTHYVVAGSDAGGSDNLVLIGNTHIDQCEIYQAPTEPAPTLALGFTIVPLADMHVASEVAAHLGLPMPVLPAALVTQAGHA